MSYQVLARKYRPRNFQEMVGQEHVLRALINALQLGRLHHAYLFTGTRGVGKTSVARLLAKCLNCETGVTANPCNACSNCHEIDTGKFVDLIEIDAASRTKVEDMRELLENVQYASTRGRYKVYLIDEVHMLSNHSFNALLKTLEEPPSHIKFLLATTDPQRLPVTILSRCLQFNLKNLSAEHIQAQLENILLQEKISYETAALKQLARAANGSLRDALSLLDQAIAYGNQEVQETAIRAMLGTIEQASIFELLDALTIRDGKTLITLTQKLAEQTADFNQVMEELLITLQQIATLQIVPDAYSSTSENYEKLKMLAGQLPPEDVQLYYQILLMGRRDLPLAPDPRSGFEMILLRLLAFNIEKSTTVQSAPQTPSTPTKSIGPKELMDWTTLITQLNLTGFTQALALNCVLKTASDTHIELELDPNQSALLNPKQEARLAEALSTYFQKPIKLSLRIGAPQLLTPTRLKQNQTEEQRQTTTQKLHRDPNIQAMAKFFDATLQHDSIQTQTPDMLTQSET